MSLTRKLLESMGLESDKVSTIIEAHAESIDALKAQIDTYKTEASKLEEVQKELSATKTELESLRATGGDWQKKFEEEHASFELFKTQQSEKDAKNAKESAFKALLREAGISEKRLDSILKVSDLSDIVLEEGKIKDADKLTENIKTEWSDFITTQQISGASTPTPPANNGQTIFSRDDISKMSREQINQNWEAVSASLNN